MAFIPEFLGVGGQLLFYVQENLDQFADYNRPERRGVLWRDAKEEHSETEEYLCLYRGHHLR